MSKPRQHLVMNRQPIYTPSRPFQIHGNVRRAGVAMIVIASLMLLPTPREVARAAEAPEVGTAYSTWQQMDDPRSRTTPGRLFARSPSASKSASPVPLGLGRSAPCVSLNDRLLRADPLRAFLCKPAFATRGITSSADLTSLLPGQGSSRKTASGPAQASGTQGDGGSCSVTPSVNERCPSWTNDFVDPNAQQSACQATYDEAVGPRGVYVLGLSCGSDTNFDLATVAYDAAGRQMWAARHNGPGNTTDLPSAVAADDQGARVFVAGLQDFVIADNNSTADGVLVAHDAATGTKLWQALYQGSEVGLHGISDVAVSPDGTRVYVTGATRETAGSDTAYGFDATTAAFDAATGRQLWAAHYDDAQQGDDFGASISVANGNLYVGAAACVVDCSGVVLAYDAASGAQRWVQDADAMIPMVDAGADAVVAAGTRVVVPRVLPCTRQVPKHYDGLSTYTTTAYDAATGARSWSHDYAAAPLQGLNELYSVALTPNGDTTLVTGVSSGPQNTCDLHVVTIAYDTASGREMWVKDYKQVGVPPV